VGYVLKKRGLISRVVGPPGPISEKKRGVKTTAGDFKPTATPKAGATRSQGGMKREVDVGKRSRSHRGEGKKKKASPRGARPTLIQGLLWVQKRKGTGEGGGKKKKPGEINGHHAKNLTT